ncbi:hypothetical protein DPMN_118159 [Dreissena polymorpha]|uniref:Uncharacterized protein n=1 Tax=Dreissena polymorpha TaxID=45954 RepID=A0A9D4GJJ8_DREPO|nr:hypothetical protein DPMN_118159 [Dreissena polymorpha]
MTAPPPWRPCLLPIRTIFKPNRHIQKTHVLTKFHEDWTKNVTYLVKNCPAPWRYVFSPFWTSFELFHDDWAKLNTAPPPGGHTNILTKGDEDWASNVTSTVFTIFELSRGINGTNILTKFHEDRTINMASRVFTKQNVDDARLTTHDERRTKSDHKSSP